MRFIWIEFDKKKRDLWLKAIRKDMDDFKLPKLTEACVSLDESLIQIHNSVQLVFHRIAQSSNFWFERSLVI